MKDADMAKEQLHKSMPQGGLPASKDLHGPHPDTLLVEPAERA